MTGQNPPFMIRQVSVAAGTLLPALLDTIGRLRTRAWDANGERPSHAPSGELWLESQDDTAEHFIIDRGGVVVAAARVSIHAYENELPDLEVVSEFTRGLNWPTASMNRLCVLPEARCQGLSRLLDMQRIEFAERAEFGIKDIIVTTQIASRISWLVECGFRIAGVSSHRLESWAPTSVLVRSTKRGGNDSFGRSRSKTAAEH